jgi:hypothetical protein
VSFQKYIVLLHKMRNISTKKINILTIIDVAYIVISVFRLGQLGQSTRNGCPKGDDLFGNSR